MQLLNVRVGRTDAECKADEEQRLADLREEAKNDANYFFWAAAAAALGTGIGLVRVGFLVSIGAADLLLAYGSSLGALHWAAMYVLGLTWVVGLIGLALAARYGYRWAFVAGIVLYAADMIALILTFSLWAFGLHSFFIYKWFQGQRALKELSEANALGSLSATEKL